MEEGSPVSPDGESSVGDAALEGAEESLDLPFTGERVVPRVMPPGDPVLLEHLSRYLFARSFVPGKRVLDAASGSGYGSAMLAAAGAREVVGLDRDPSAVLYARRVYGGPGVSFLVGDVRAMPFADGEFEGVVSFETIEHLEELRAFLGEVVRVLAPGGVFLVSTPNNLTGVVQNPFHRREYSAPEFASLLGEFFGEVRMHGQNPHPDASPTHVRPEGGRERSTWWPCAGGFSAGDRDFRRRGPPPPPIRPGEPAPLWPIWCDILCQGQEVLFCSNTSEYKRHSAAEF